MILGDIVSASAGTSAAIDPAQRVKTRDAAEKFEAFFINELLRQMRRSARALSAEADAGEGRRAGDLLDMADTMFADAMARQRAFGIADLLLRQLLPQPQELKPATADVAYPGTTPHSRMP